MSYRNDVDALEARHQALSNELAAKTRELETASRLLDEAKLKAKLPVLPNIRVATPCTADWQKMSGDERVRACADCNKNVYNLSEMTRDEAEALILEKEGRLCVRYYQRKDGTILLKDCLIGVAASRKRKLVAAGAAALLTGGGFAAYKLTRPEKVEEVATHCATYEPVEPALGVTEVMPQEAAPPAPVVEDDEPEEKHIMGKIAIEDYEVRMGDVSAPDPGDPLSTK